LILKDFFIECLRKITKKAIALIVRIQIEEADEILKELKKKPRESTGVYKQSNHSMSGLSLLT